jgi:hypothetical protein
MYLLNAAHFCTTIPIKLAAGLSAATILFAKKPKKPV